MGATVGGGEEKCVEEDTVGVEGGRLDDALRFWL